MSRLCRCGGPADIRDRLRCSECHHWRPRGSLPLPPTVTELADEIASLLGRFCEEDYPWVHSIAWSPRRRGDGGGRAVWDSNPTLDAVESKQMEAVRDWAIVAARLLERALRDVKDADSAIGRALLAAEDEPDDEHHSYVDVNAVPPTRADLLEAHAYRERRKARREGIPT